MTLWDFLVRADEEVNEAFLGVEGETISSRLGRCARRHGGTVPWEDGLRAASVLYRVIEAVAPGHCERNIENLQETQDVR